MEANKSYSFIMTTETTGYFKIESDNKDSKFDYNTYLELKGKLIRDNWKIVKIENGIEYMELRSPSRKNSLDVDPDIVFYG